MAFRFTGDCEPVAVGPDGQVLLRLQRTASGDAELRDPALPLAAPARALLSRFDGESPVEHCLASEPGARLADAMSLVPLGLIRTRSCIATSRQAPRGVQLRSLVDAIFGLSSEDIYLVLTHQAKLRLGLIHSFRLVLELERCVGPDEERALALRFVELIWRTHGEAGLRQFHRYLLS